MTEVTNISNKIDKRILSFTIDDEDVGEGLADSRGLVETYKISRIGTTSFSFLF